MCCANKTHTILDQNKKKIDTVKPVSRKERTVYLGVVMFNDIKCNPATYDNVRCGVSEIAGSSAQRLS